MNEGAAARRSCKHLEMHTKKNSSNVDKTDQQVEGIKMPLHTQRALIHQAYKLHVQVCTYTIVSDMARPVIFMRANKCRE